MANTRRELRVLIYSFKMDAARQRLNSEDPPSISRKFLARLIRAIRYNIDSPLLTDSVSSRTDTRCVGRWWARWPNDNRLRIKGTVNQGCKQVALFFNDRLVKLVNTVPRPGDALQRRSFRYNVKDDILKSLPRKTVIGVGSTSGYLRHRNGGLTFRDDKLSGDASLFRLLTETHFLNKKGRLQRRLDKDIAWKMLAMSAYAKFRSYFESTFAYQPFIICGTLLGFHRDGDFIAHDDDMDVAYFSRHSAPQDIAAELTEIVTQMLSDGYDIKLSRNRGFFKPNIDGFSFDVFPMWHDRDCLWMMNTTRQQTKKDTIWPIQNAKFRGVDVYVPNKVEQYIENEYGPDWRVPDPGYRAVGEASTAEYLADSCIRIDEIRQLQRDSRKALDSGCEVGKLSIVDTDIDTLLG